MPFPGERMVPRGSIKQWVELPSVPGPPGSNMRARLFTNGVIERVDIEFMEGQHKRRLYFKEGPNAAARAESFFAGHAVGLSTISRAPLTPPPKVKTGKKKT